MACVGQEGIQSTPFLPHLAEDPSLCIVVADIELEEGCIQPKLGDNGFARFLLQVAASYEPSFGYKICCESLANT